MANDPTDELTVTTDPEEIRSWAESRQLVPAYVRADEAAELEAEAAGGRPEFVGRDELGEHHETRDWDAFLRTIEEEELALAYRDADEAAGHHYALVEQSGAAEVSGEDLRAAGAPPEDASGGAAEEATTDGPTTGEEAGETGEGIPTETGVTGETGAAGESGPADEGPAGESPPADETPPAAEAGEPAGTEEAETPDEPVAAEDEGTPPADETPPTEEAGEPGVEPTDEPGTEPAGETPGDVNAAGESGATDELGGAGTSTDIDETSPGAERPDQTEETPGTDDPRGTADATVSEHDEGKTVVDANDNEVGIVTEVRGGDVYVDPDPDIVEKVAAKLGWASADEESYTIDQRDVVAVRHDEVRVAPIEGLDR